MTEVRIEKQLLRPGGTYPIAGRRAIMVEGVQWGSIEPESHGSRGNTYLFWQTGAAEVVMHDPDDLDHRQKPRRVEVRSAGKREQRYFYYGPFDTTEARLLRKARDLVRRGVLRDPEIVKVERDERRTRMRRYTEEQDREEAIERRLKRAAPAMLTALKTLVDAIKHRGVVPSRHELDEAKRAIAMAEGEPAAASGVIDTSSASA